MGGSGVFISFEGGEGSGKTTQIAHLRTALLARHVDVVTTREPGGTPESETIRNLIVQSGGNKWSPMAECLLVMAARQMHLQNLILPALERGGVVITDRFTDSTYVYQGYGRGLNLDAIKAIEAVVLEGIKPDLTFILDIDPETGLGRSKRRLANTGGESVEDHFEQMDLSFHRKIRQGFLEIAEKDRQRCVVIDASGSEEDISRRIVQIVNERLK